MYIQSIRIQGFRNFSDSTIEFNEGINVIIGHNNAGKSNLLKALSLILDGKSSRKLEIEDINKNQNLDVLKKAPPKVTISLTIAQSEGEDLTSDDLVTVANWLVKLEEPYQAILTYEFFLPETETAKYLEKVASFTATKQVWNTIKHDFLQKYVAKIYGGNPALQSTADAESLSKFDFQFLDAIRDVERDMFTGRHTLLREVIDFFMDYEIKIDEKKEKPARAEEIRQKKLAFSDEATLLVGKLQERMKSGEKHILQYAEDTGASFDDAKPGFDGVISEAELYSALKLIIKHNTGIEIPATHNGLGYNNLIYMSLLLAKMQVDTNSDYYGSNAKVFPVLVIEEPEAHLHPAMQYKFLKFLQGNVKTRARQVFVSSHSTQITSAVTLDEIICLHSKGGKVSVGYPGRVFSDDAAGKASKAYVQRFLDATKSDMLFANSIILVEGTAEQLLLSTLARYCDAKKNLEDNHVAGINIGGRYFEHFLKLFDSAKDYTIPKRVACLTDRDPVRREKKDGDSFTVCYPYEYNIQPDEFDYQDHATALISMYQAHPSIRFFSQPEGTGKTFEYELIMTNPTCGLFLMATISNKDELKRLMEALKAKKTLNQIKDEGVVRASVENTRIWQGLEANTTTTYTDEMKLKALLASRYLNSVGKGANALELANILEENLSNGAGKEVFIVPTYISEAITWVCQ